MTDPGTADPDVDWYIDYAIVKDPRYNAKRVIYRVKHCDACDAIVWTILSDPDHGMYTSWAGAWQAIREGAIEWGVQPQPLTHPVPPCGC